jgi:hypothetical protein
MPLQYQSIFKCQLGFTLPQPQLLEGAIFALNRIIRNIPSPSIHPWAITQPPHIYPLQPNSSAFCANGCFNFSDPSGTFNLKGMLSLNCIIHTVENYNTFRLEFGNDQYISNNSWKGAEPLTLATILSIVRVLSEMNILPDECFFYPWNPSEEPMRKIVSLLSGVNKVFDMNVDNWNDDKIRATLRSEPVNWLNSREVGGLVSAMHLYSVGS